MRMPSMRPNVRNLGIADFVATLPKVRHAFAPIQVHQTRAIDVVLLVPRKLTAH